MTSPAVGRRAVQSAAKSVMTGGLLVALSCASLARAPADVVHEEQTFSADGSSWSLSVPAGYRLEWVAEMDRPRMLTRAAGVARAVAEVAAEAGL